MLNIRGVAVATLFLSFVTLPVSAQEPGRKLSSAATGRHRLPMVGIVAPADESSSYQYVDLGPKGNQALARRTSALRKTTLKEVPQSRARFRWGRSSRSAKRWSTSGEVAQQGRGDQGRRPGSTSFTSSPRSSAKCPARSRTALRLAATSSIPRRQDRRDDPHRLRRDVRELVGDSMMDWNKPSRGKSRLAGQEQHPGGERLRDSAVSEAWITLHLTRWSPCSTSSQGTACAPRSSSPWPRNQRKRVPPRGPVR